MKNKLTYSFQFNHAWQKSEAEYNLAKKIAQALDVKLQISLL
ncbi:MAG: hypothetical protein V1810_01825 [Candidatus Beckwithbacteria bacterium]